MLQQLLLNLPYGCV